VNYGLLQTLVVPAFQQCVSRPLPLTIHIRSESTADTPSIIMGKHDFDDTVVISQCNQSNLTQKRRILTPLVRLPDVALDYIVQYAATRVLVTRVFDATWVPIPF
jgi:hypothetical protein